MGKKIAIKGHSTRGKEIIGLLEMMGGKNIYNLNGLFSEYAYYFIGGPRNDEIRGGEYIFGIEDIYSFTLEEFLKKYPFKVGDKVIYTKFGDNCYDYPATIESMKWTGTTIEYTFDDCVTCLAKDLKMWNGETDAVISGIHLNSYDYADEVELNLGDYKIEVRDGRTFAVKKKPKYPKTYEECCKVLNYKPDFYDADKYLIYGYMSDKLRSFQKLLVCRDAYWKIAGEQMELGKPWEPDFGKDTNYCIFYYMYNKNYQIYRGNYNNCNNKILAFPTEDIADEFYENFKDLIEQCKKFL